MTDTVGNITQLSTNPGNEAIRGAGFLPAGKQEAVQTQQTWRLKGLLASTGQWVIIDTYANEALAKDAFILLRTRSKFSDRVHVRDTEAFAVYAIEASINVQYLGGVLRG